MTEPCAERSEAPAERGRRERSERFRGSAREAEATSARTALARWLVLGVLGGTIVAAPARRAEADAAADAEAAKLAAEGEELARKLEWSRAIEKFKRADALVQRARHACLIGLAYHRRELFSQAEIFLALCHERATDADPVPAWLGDTEKELGAKLAALDVAAVEIKVEPADAAATAVVTVSAFAPDETFRPRTIHLPRGSHVITATAPGYPTRSETVTITGRDPVAVTIDVAEQDVVPIDPRPAPQPPAASKWLLIGAGGLAVAGGVFHYLAYDQKKALDDARSLDEYKDHEGKFDAFRIATFSAYGLAAVAAGVGIYLRVRAPRDEGPVVSGALAPDGGMVVVEWRR
jgi:hypothetical protein